jgi:hypothetical protein
MIISDFDNTRDELEDLSIRLKSIFKSPLSAPLENEIEDEILKLRDQIVQAEESIQLIFDT